ncbi:helix-turn-helix domain-containing protein [Sandaracinus amylolyticus]|nr:helix-turn-helix transcriptional regulator [Sandaracinus amylolyticus]
MGQRLRRARGGMTQVALSEATKINQSTLSKYERGEIEPGIDSIVAIAEATGACIEWLATGVGDPPADSATPDAAA